MVTKERLAELATSKSVLIGTASALSFLAGAASGAIIAIKKLETNYEERVKEEARSAQTFYKKLYKKGEYASIIDLDESQADHTAEEESELLDEAVGALRSYQGNTEEDSEEDSIGQHLLSVQHVLDEVGETPVQVTHNVFDEDDSNWNWDDELKSRDESRPYVIHHDEFMQAEQDYEQSTLTYFHEDGILSDERDQVIDNEEVIVGTDLIPMKFGHGSKDNNVVYIRNDRLCVDFEVVRSNGSYAKQVAGFIQHSDHRSSIRRFRSDDE